MMSSGHAYGQVTNTEKMQRLPGKLLYQDFSLIQYFNLNLHYAVHRFCFISTRSDFESISKYWKICNFLKKA